MTHLKFLRVMGIALLSFILFSCDNDLQINMPKGPQGPDGKSAYDLWLEGLENGTIIWDGNTDLAGYFLYYKGKDGKNGVNGLSAYEVWVQEVEKGLEDPHNKGKEWDKSKTKKNDFWYYLTGADGKDGLNGSTPQIGENGNWWIDGVDTGKPSKGADGKDGTKITISKNNTWVVDGTDTGIPLTGQNGKDGTVVYIGTNGNWFVDGKDTTIPARGVDGTNGKDGTNGSDGKSAYQIWVVEVINGLEDPHNPGQNWDNTKITMDDFWYYLRGKTGANGKDGQSGKDGSVVTIGDNGNWWIDGKDTGKPSKGADGQNGSTPEIGNNGNWWIDGVDTGKPAIGKDGQAGLNGQNGTDGRTPEIEIGKNGNWWIDGQDTGKPAFGKDGENGSNGSNGLSAYELWKQEAETGQMDDPKNPEQKWPKDKTSTQDFWEYLKGKDGVDGNNGQNGQDGKNGQSAYELWKDEVAKGLLNPHDETGGNWPKDKTTVEDFWEYLRGKDGKDGSDGEDGETIIKGVPNVLPEFYNASLKEYIDVKDGSVLYKAYNEKGDIAPNAVVSNLPGIPGKTYTADANGTFVIKKEDLPADLSEAERTGSCTVQYTNSSGTLVTETSAPNTLVPNRMQVRIKALEAPFLNWFKEIGGSEFEHSTINVKFLVERRTSTSAAWEAIPAGLGNLNQNIIAYELSSNTNPLSYTAMSKQLYNGTHDISIAGEIKVKRPTKKTDYLSEKFQSNRFGLWDGNDHYFNFTLESYYGESPNANVIVKVAPIQMIPMIKNAHGYGAFPKFLEKVEGEFDVSSLDYSLFFNKTYQETNNGGYISYAPTLMSKAEVDATKTLYIVFTIEGNASSNLKNISSIASPQFTVDTPYIGSTAGLQARDHLFQGVGYIGVFQEKSAGSGQFYIKADKAWMGNELPDIEFTMHP